MPDLFTPLDIRELRIPNRVAMPPMVCFNWSDAAGLATERHVVYYAARAKGGCGLIVLEAHCVQNNGRLRRSQLGLWSDEQIEGLRRHRTDPAHRLEFPEWGDFNRHLAGTAGSETRETALACSLAHVYWIGGSPCAGKSTVADMLGERYGVHVYHVDDHAEDHSARATATDQPRSGPDPPETRFRHFDLRSWEYAQRSFHGHDLSYTQRPSFRTAHSRLCPRQ